MDLVSKPLGKEGNLDLSFVEGKLKIAIGIDTKGTDAGIYIDLDTDYFLDLLADAIPGDIDDIIIATLKASFK